MKRNASKIIHSLKAMMSISAMAAFASSICLGFDGDVYADLAVGVTWEAIGTIDNAGAVMTFYGSNTGLRGGGSGLFSQDDSGGTDESEMGDEFGSLMISGDFNADGWEDLAIGIPYESVENVQRAGAVQVMYGSADKLSMAGNMIFHQSSPGIAGFPETNDEFGNALAAGDFDRDGFIDLAIGVHKESISAQSEGCVQILYGTADGLNENRNQIFFQGDSGIPGPAGENDYFGAALTSSDFNGDGYWDLAIGISEKDISGIEDAGQVIVLRGSSAGLVGDGCQIWDQDSAYELNGIGENYRFGSVLSAGDFNGDGYNDLLIGVPWQNNAEGFVYIIYGSASGLTPTNVDVFTQSGNDEIESGDRFGDALTAGDFNGDGYDDFAAGSPYENRENPTIIGAGLVIAFYGSADGVWSSNSQLWYQGYNGVQGVSEEFDCFGASLAAGDFNDDSRCDLAIGIPGEPVDGVGQAGAVCVLNGSPFGLTSEVNRLWHQNTDAVPGVAEVSDHFGFSLAATGRIDSQPHSTPTPSASRGVALDMPSHFFQNGDSCGLTAYLFNSGGALDGVELFIILDITGQYWFYPGWTQNIDSQEMTVPSGGDVIGIIPGFAWPDTGASSMYGIVFWGALWDSSSSQVVGGTDGIGSWEFGFGP